MVMLHTICNDLLPQREQADLGIAKLHVNLHAQDCYLMLNGYLRFCARILQYSCCMRYVQLHDTVRCPCCV